jgi:hypothetical protein
MLSKVKSRPNSDRQFQSGQSESIAAKKTFLQQNLNDQDLFQLVQTRAYYLWEKAGKPEGEQYKEQFWFEAEQQVSLGR